jgi:hypothetical protein
MSVTEEDLLIVASSYMLERLDLFRQSIKLDKRRQHRLPPGMTHAFAAILALLCISATTGYNFTDVSYPYSLVGPFKSCVIYLGVAQSHLVSATGREESKQMSYGQLNLAPVLGLILKNTVGSSVRCLNWTESSLDNMYSDYLALLVGEKSARFYWPDLLYSGD